MYVKNAKKLLLDLNFTENKDSKGDDGENCEYYYQVNEKIQLLVVVTRPDNIFFISEHNIIKPHNKYFEDDDENFDIYSEYILKQEFLDILKKYEIINQEKIITLHEAGVI